MAWETFAITNGLFYFDISVEFEDIKFLRATTITKDSVIEFTIVVQPGTGRFEISEGSSTLVTGFIRQKENIVLTDLEDQRDKTIKTLQNRDFYKELRLRGYHYNELFRSVVEASTDGLYGKVRWDKTSNWVAFLDCLLQIHIVGQDTRSLILPTSIQKVVIDTQKQLLMSKQVQENEDGVFEVFVSNELKTIRTGGIEIVNLKASNVSRRRPPGIPVLESYKFLPYHSPSLNTTNAIRVLIQLALENAPTSKLKAVEIDGNVRPTLLTDIEACVDDLPLVAPLLTFVSTKTLENEKNITVENSKLANYSDCYMIIVSDCINNFDQIEKSALSLADVGFLILREKKSEKPTNLRIPEKFILITSITTEDETLIMMKYNKKNEGKEPMALTISEKDANYLWIDDLKPLLKNEDVVLVAENEPTSGLIGLVNCIRKEPEGLRVSCIFIDDRNAPKFSLDNPIYRNQLKLGLAINVLRNGIWGSYRHLSIQQSVVERSALDHCYVNALVKSDLSSLKWISGPFNYSKPKGQIVKIQYAALNFKDVMLATGKISAEIFVETRLEHECILGIEYSGVTKEGQRVMGMTTAAAMVCYL